MRGFAQRMGSVAIPQSQAVVSFEAPSPKTLAVMINDYIASYLVEIDSISITYRTSEVQDSRLMVGNTFVALVVFLEQASP